MLLKLRLLLGISIFWLGLSMLTDGVNTLVLPLQLSNLLGKSAQASALGLLTFVGLLAGALIQPYAGALSDQLRPALARKGFIAAGLLLSLVALAVFGLLHSLPGLVLGYLGIQLAASIAQAGQQGLIPDLVDEEHRGMASGLKGFMDVGGAMVGFIVLGHLLDSGSLLMTVAAIAAVLVVLYAIAALFTPEDRATSADARPSRPPSSAAEGRFSPRAVFSIDPLQHRAFIRLLLARFLFLLGIYATGRFLLYFVADRLHLQAGRAAEGRFSPRAVFSIDRLKHGAFMRLLLARFLFLLGIYATGRFLLYFVADRLNLQAGRAAAEAGNILAALALITVLAAPIGGWLADRYGRLALMVAGALLGAASAASLILAHTELQMLMFGGLMSLGSAAFSGGSWALLADLVPKRESARFFGLANLSTAGSSAAAGLLGPVLDGAQRISPGSGYTVLFLLAAIAFLASAFPVTPSLLKEVTHVEPNPGTQDQVRADTAGLAVVLVPADPAGLEEDQDPSAGTTPA